MPGMSCPPDAAEQPIATAGRSRLRRQPKPRSTAQPLAPASRWRRWARRIGITLLAAGLALTGGSLIFNALTQPPRLIAPDYGSYATVGSTHVHYETWGTGGTPVVLVPGFVESSIVWRPSAEILAQRHIVYALDLPGFGYTHYSGGYGMHDIEEVVDGFIHTMGLQHPILVGHSMGAAVVGAVALAHPGDVGKVVFADGDGLPVSTGPSILRLAVVDSPFFTSGVRLAEHGTSLIKDFIKSSCGPACLAPSTVFVDQWLRPLRQQAGESALHDLLDAGALALSPQQIAAISVPATIIWGTEDHQGGSLQQTIANLHHPPTHMIGGAAHLSMLADPAAFAQAVDE